MPLPRRRLAVAALVAALAPAPVAGCGGTPPPAGYTAPMHKPDPAALLEWERLRRERVREGAAWALAAPPAAPAAVPDAELARAATAAAAEAGERARGARRAALVCQARGQQVRNLHPGNGRSLLELDAIAAGNQTARQCYEVWQATGAIP